jgi:hypothetical protein
VNPSLKKLVTTSFQCCAKSACLMAVISAAYDSA